MKKLLANKHRFKYLLGAGVSFALILVVGFVLLNASGTPDTKQMPPVLLTEEQKQELKAGKEDHKPSDLQFHIIATENSFTPSEIEVKKDDMVRILFTSAQGENNFILPEYNVVLPPTVPGKNMAIQFKADKAGTFTFSSFKTDPKSPTKTGKLIVK